MANCIFRMVTVPIHIVLTMLSILSPDDANLLNRMHYYCENRDFCCYLNSFAQPISCIVPYSKTECEILNYSVTTFLQKSIFHSQKTMWSIFKYILLDRFLQLSSEHLLLLSSHRVYIISLECIIFILTQ